MFDGSSRLMATGKEWHNLAKIPKKAHEVSQAAFVLDCGGWCLLAVVLASTSWANQNPKDERIP